MIFGYLWIEIRSILYLLVSLSFLCPLSDTLDIILVKLTINRELETECTKFERVRIYWLVCLLSVRGVTVCDTLVTLLDI